MVKNRIKVCARIKGGKQPTCKITYFIEKKEEEESLCIQIPDSSSNGTNSKQRNRGYKFRFSRVFDMQTKQEEIFNMCAIPIINSFLNGFNATIFAYGQTGSGKTFTITGPPENYNDRGIIPRSIEQVFRFTSKNSEKFSICISYMEIYNEVGYDLLDSKHQAYSFDQLPKVVLLEDRNGEAHTRNLSIHNVSCEKEAMRLLFLGDTNRTIAETPSNEISSRSHCIFTIYLSCWVGDSKKIRRSKLNLVDLAGSERINKSNIYGLTLTEAKSINLSLYYLEQVILALSEAKRSHVPYRNSMMTSILKDSLGGNCFTLMLATISPNYNSIEETLSTCKFSQRVAMVSTDAYINEDSDPYNQIECLSKEIEQLKSQIKLQNYSHANTNSALTDDEISNCKEIVDNFINDPESPSPNLQPNMRLLNQCFVLMKNEICQLKSECNKNNHNHPPVCDYDEIIRQKDEEIQRLSNQLNNILQKESEVNRIPYPHLWNRSHGNPYQERDIPHPNTNLKKSDEEIRILKLHDDLNKKYDVAKSIVPLIEQCQKNIIIIRKKLDSDFGIPPENQNQLIKELHSQQDIYRDSLQQLQTLKSEVEHLEHGLQQAEFSMGKNLKQWACETSTQYSLKHPSATDNNLLPRSGERLSVSSCPIPERKEIGIQTSETKLDRYQQYTDVNSSYGKDNTQQNEQNNDQTNDQQNNDQNKENNSIKVLVDEEKPLSLQEVKTDEDELPSTCQDQPKINDDQEIVSSKANPSEIIVRYKTHSKTDNKDEERSEAYDLFKKLISNPEGPIANEKPSEVIIKYKQYKKPNETSEMPLDTDKPSKKGKSPKSTSTKNIKSSQPRKEEATKKKFRKITEETEKKHVLDRLEKQYRLNTYVPNKKVSSWSNTLQSLDKNLPSYHNFKSFSEIDQLSSEKYSQNTSKLNNIRKPALHRSVTYDEYQKKYDCAGKRISTMNNSKERVNFKSLSAREKAVHPLQEEYVPQLIKNLAESLFKSDLLSKSDTEKNELTEFSTPQIKNLDTEETDINQFLGENFSKTDFFSDYQSESLETFRTCTNIDLKHSESELFQPRFENDNNVDVSKDSQILNNAINLNAEVQCEEFFKPNDTKSFMNFIKTVPLTGDREVDEEIVSFYRSKFEHH